MQQQPLDYETPPRDRSQIQRRRLGRAMVASWMLFAAASAFLLFNSDDRNPLQWTAAMLMALAMLFAAVMTLAYCLVVVVLWFRGRQPNASR